MRENFCYCETSKFHTSFDQIIQILILMFLCCTKTGWLLVNQTLFHFIHLYLSIITLICAYTVSNMGYQSFHWDVNYDITLFTIL